jgi:hypothetical protein
MKRFAAALALAVVAVSACGSDSLPPGGEGDLPTRRSDESYRYNATILSGLLADGGDCWVLDLGDGPRPVLFPVGFEIAGDDAVSSAAGEVMRVGTGVDGMGGLVPLADLPVRDDGSLDELGGCVADAREAIVFEDLAPAFDPALLTAEDWVALVEGADFTAAWGCGIGFAVSTADQHVALLVHADAMGQAIDSVVTLPHEQWSAQVLVGKQLMAQWCDDAVELWEPTPTVSGTWQITAGTLDFGPGTAPETECNGTVTATLEGIRVDTPSGEIALGDLELVNQAFGCFAG